MVHSIWKQLKSARQPFFALAPMDDVTDTVFREIVASVAAPDVMFTEFASADGFVHPKGRGSVESRLRFSDSEQALGVPLIAQIWGSDPNNFYKMTADLVARGQFAGIDINMGCPVKGKVKRGSCGGLIKEDNWQKASEIITATKSAAGELPVSVKTRIGFNKVITEEWCAHLLGQGLAALSVHGRTVRELSRVPARWDEIGKVAHLRDQIAPDTVVLGNGDVASRAQGVDLAINSGVDGVMIGRGVFHNLFVFSVEQHAHPPEEMIRILLRHIELYEQTWGESKSYSPMKKFCKLYINGFAGAAELRAQLMETTSPSQARELLLGYRAPLMV